MEKLQDLGLPDIAKSGEQILKNLLAAIPAPWLERLSDLRLETSAETLSVAALELVLFIFAVRLVRRRRREVTGDGDPDLDQLTRKPRRFGYATAILLVFGLGTWSALAPLSGAAIAPGVISPEGNRRTVQHLEGGIVSAIHVREGDSVAEGQILLTLEDIAARARFDELHKRYIHLLARAARLEAELRDSPKLEIPSEERVVDQAELEVAILSQQELLTRRIATRRGRSEILQKRVNQLDEENHGLELMILGQDEKTLLIQEEIESVTELLERGLERRPRLLALERAAADIGIQRAGNQAQIARNNQAIGETEIQLLTMQQQDVENVSEELAEVRRALSELDSEMPWRADVLYRTEIRAPISGTVMDVRVTTLSGVLQGGEPILDIVPSQVPLVIDARVNPIDIDVVRVGMTARVILSAYQQRNMLQIQGFLRSVSADRLVEDRTGSSYFLAKIEVPSVELENLQGVALMPGMPADVMLLTGEATVADYIIGPLLGSVRKSFRENHGS